MLSLYLLLFQGTSPIGGAITGGLADVWSIEVAITSKPRSAWSVAFGFGALRRGEAQQKSLSG